MIGHGCSASGSRAEAHFEAALALNTRLGARTWLAHTSYEYARMLLGRRSGRRPRARAGAARRRGRPRPGDRHAHAPRAAPPSSAPASSPRTELPDGLSAREVEILVELAHGHSNRDIGRVLHISEHTAANHVRSILRKTRMRQPDRGSRLCPPARARARRERRPRLVPSHHALYVIERTFAERLELTGDDVRLIDDVNADEGVSWLFSFISADKLRSYCLYEAPSPDAIIEAARRRERARRRDRRGEQVRARRVLWPRPVERLVHCAPCPGTS